MRVRLLVVLEVIAVIELMDVKRNTIAVVNEDDIFFFQEQLLIKIMVISVMIIVVTRFMSYARTVVICFQFKD